VTTLAVWQKLNVTAFLTSGIVGVTPGLLGAPYEDAAGNTYHALAIQPMIVLAADAGTIQTIYQRTMRRGVRLSRYIDDMFRTGHDEANRATVKRARPEEMKVVGLALREDKKVVDKVTAGARCTRSRSRRPFRGARAPSRCRRQASGRSRGSRTKRPGGEAVGSVWGESEASP